MTAVELSVSKKSNNSHSIQWIEGLPNKVKEICLLFDRGHVNSLRQELVYSSLHGLTMQRA